MLATGPAPAVELRATELGARPHALSLVLVRLQDGKLLGLGLDEGYDCNSPVADVQSLEWGEFDFQANDYRTVVDFAQWSVFDTRASRAGACNLSAVRALNFRSFRLHSAVRAVPIPSAFHTM